MYTAKGILQLQKSSELLLFAVKTVEMDLEVGFLTVHGSQPLSMHMAERFKSGCWISKLP